MKIVMLGAGQVGGSVAHILASEANDVTVVDANAERLQALQDRLDIRTVCGHAAYPGVLEQAGVADADMLIALTDNDEVNMIACQVAHTLFNTPTKIARVRAGLYHLSGSPVQRSGAADRCADQPRTTGDGLHPPYHRASRFLAGAGFRR